MSTGASWFWGKNMGPYLRLKNFSPKCVDHQQTYKIYLHILQQSWILSAWPAHVRQLEGWTLSNAKAVLLVGTDPQLDYVISKQQQGPESCQTLIRTVQSQAWDKGIGLCTCCWASVFMHALITYTDNYVEALLLSYYMKIQPSGPVVCLCKHRVAEKPL